MTAAFTSDETDEAVQGSIVAAYKDAAIKTDDQLLLRAAACIEHNNTGATNGGDIVHYHLLTAQACGHLCQTTAGCCLAFYDSRDGMCFL